MGAITSRPSVEMIAHAPPGSAGEIGRSTPTIEERPIFTGWARLAKTCRREPTSQIARDPTNPVATRLTSTSA